MLRIDGQLEFDVFSNAAVIGKVARRLVADMQRTAPRSTEQAIIFQPQDASATGIHEKSQEKRSKEPQPILVGPIPRRSEIIPPQTIPWPGLRSQSKRLGIGDLAPRITGVTPGYI